MLTNEKQIFQLIEIKNIWHRISKYDRYCFEQYVITKVNDPIQLFHLIFGIYLKNNLNSIVSFILSFSQDYKDELYYDKNKMFFEDYQQQKTYIKNVKPYYCGIGGRSLSYISEDLQILVFNISKFNAIEFKELQQNTDWLKMLIVVDIDELLNDVQMTVTVKSFKIINDDV